MPSPMPDYISNMFISLDLSFQPGPHNVGLWSSNVVIYLHITLSSVTRFHSFGMNRQSFLRSQCCIHALFSLISLR